jgi:hypothetical protein
MWIEPPCLYDSVLLPKVKPTPPIPIKGNATL